jgi:hypothetical protein
MTHVLLLNLVFFGPAVCGASAFAYCIHRLVKSAPPTPPPTPPHGGSPVPQPVAGPDDLARSA